MNLKTLRLIAMVAILPHSLSAQTWAPAQLEIIDQIESCFRSWWQATNANDFNIF